MHLTRVLQRRTVKKIVKDGIFVSYFIPSVRTEDVFPVVASLPGETKAEKTGCSRGLFHSKPPALSLWKC